MTTKNPYETRGRRRLSKFDSVLKTIESNIRRGSPGEIRYRTTASVKDAKQLRFLTSFRELKDRYPDVIIRTYTLADCVMICWEREEQ